MHKRLRLLATPVRVGIGFVNQIARRLLYPQWVDACYGSGVQTGGFN